MPELEFATNPLRLLTLVAGTAAAFIQALLLMIFLRWASRANSARHRTLRRHSAGAGWALGANLLVLGVLGFGMERPAWQGLFATLSENWPITAVAWAVVIVLVWIAGLKSSRETG